MLAIVLNSDVTNEELLSINSITARYQVITIDPADHRYKNYSSVVQYRMNKQSFRFSLNSHINNGHVTLHSFIHSEHTYLNRVTQWNNGMDPGSTTISRCILYETYD